MALAYEVSSEGMPQDVAGELGVDAGLVGNGGQDVAGAAYAEPAAAVVE